MKQETFTEEMERRFGSEAAFGTYFKDEATGTIFTPEAADELGGKIGMMPYPDLTSYLDNHTVATLCTNYARYIYDAFPGRVKILGFEKVNNPTAGIFTQNLHPGGHDFAWVDGAFIVDPWIRLVKNQPNAPIVYDLTDPGVYSVVEALYGPIEKWVRNFEAEK